MKPVATFSIVAFNPDREEWGVAVQSKFLAVGAVVPWAKVGAGAVATQSYANLMYGPDGLRLLSEGKSAEETVAALTESDDKRALRQVGVVDSQGRAAAFTGEDCYDWAGHLTGDGYCCQGNILVPGTVEALAERFEQVRGGDGELADWLVDALAAAQAAGGDKRGRQSASVLVVRQGGGYGGNNDRYLDLRVDDDPHPIEALKKLVSMHHLYFQETDPDDLVPLADVAADLQKLLAKTGHYHGPQTGTFSEETRKALRELVGTENLEERWNGEGDMIDKNVVTFLLDKYG
jgi:uncharacterized Ntn-hydrolase superfamily protein